jgi:plasmid stabilization system protein ParE
MKVIVRESALADIERIYAWIARDSPRNAESVVGRIDAAIEDKLAFFPSWAAPAEPPARVSGLCMACRI